MDLRIICATNRNLTEEVELGRFSQALFYRLNVFSINLPPLRDRKEDIPALVEYFLGQLSIAGRHFRISQRAMQCLLAYDWPGNIRELQNVLERGTILSEGDLVTESRLPKEMADAASDTHTSRPFPELREVEREHIARVLKFVNGNRTRAAELLGIGRKTLYRKLKAYGIASI